MANAKTISRVRTIMMFISETVNARTVESKAIKEDYPALAIRLRASYCYIDQKIV